MEYNLEEIRKIRDAHEVSLFEAKAIYMRRLLLTKISEATSVDDLKPILEQIVSTVRFNG